MVESNPTSELEDDLANAIRARWVPIAAVVVGLPFVLVPVMGTTLLMSAVLAMFATHPTNQGNLQALVLLIPLAVNLLMATWHFWSWLLWLRSAAAGWGGSTLTMISCYRRACWHSAAQSTLYGGAVAVTLFLRWSES